MKGFFRRISPKAAVADFASQWQEDTPHRWPILGVAMASTFAVFMLFIPDSQRAALPRPEIDYITTFAPDRSDAEIIASNCANQAFKDELEARLAERAELRREMYRALGRATFVDVDEAVAEAEAEQEAAREASGAPTQEELAAEQARSVEEYCASAVGSGVVDAR